MTDARSIETSSRTHISQHRAALGPANETFSRRRLPHYQGEGRVVLATFTSHQRWILPPEARKITLRHCLHDHGLKMDLSCAVVMPDHVHLLYRPLADPTGAFFGFSEIVGAIKSVSARMITKRFPQSGSVWQDEWHDRVLRKSEDLKKAAEYICNNPVRKGLCAAWNEYPFLWRQWEDQ